MNPPPGTASSASSSGPCFFCLDRNHGCVPFDAFLLKSKLMPVHSKLMVLPRDLFSLILLFALSFCRTFGDEANDSSKGSSSSNTYSPSDNGSPSFSSSLFPSSSPPPPLRSQISNLTCPPHLLGNVWDVHMPTLHEKLYGNRHHQRHYQNQQQSRRISALPVFAYITSSTSNKMGRGCVC